MSTEGIRREVKRRKAYRAANAHIVSAGLVLATAGVHHDAPELRMLRLALRAVNRAGGIEELPAPSVGPVQPGKEVSHGVPARAGHGLGRRGKTA
jgi:hypothetical protein